MERRCSCKPRLVRTVSEPGRSTRAAAGEIDAFICYVNCNSSSQPTVLRQAVPTHHCAGETILAPRITFARFTRSLVGLRRLTTTEIPGASPIVLDASIWCFRPLPVQVTLQRRARAAVVSLLPRMRLRSVRSEQRTTGDRI